MAGQVAADSRASIDDALLAELAPVFRGELIRPAEAGYDGARAVWNGAIDRRPALIARCTGSEDVGSVVRFARRNGLVVSVRGGGHNIAGLAVWDGAVMIDLSPMKGVQVDAGQRRARAEGGVVWGGYDLATQAFGLASPGGLMSTTGIAGFTLGGGFGWLSRTYGLACDNLLEAEVVSAEGELVRASINENPDLFWGIRGGGGNFGVVTSFAYRLHPVGPAVLCGIVFFAESQIPAVLRFLRDFTPHAPAELFVACTLRVAPAAPFLPQQAHATKVIGVGMLYVGAIDEGERAMAPLRRLASPLADIVQARPYTEWQQFLDSGWGPGANNYWKAEYLAALPDEAIDTIAEYFSCLSSPLSDIKLGCLGAAIADVDPDATAYTHRQAPFILNINSRWLEGDAEPHIDWTRAFWSALRPHSAGGVYVNFLGQEGPDRVREAYGQAKFERLTALKRKVDPTNFFRINQNIPPN